MALSQALRDVWLSVALIAGSAAVFRWTGELPEDSAFFPRLVAFFIAALSVVLLASSLARVLPARRRGERAGTPGKHKEDGSGGANTEQVPPVAWKVVLLTAAAIAAYAALLDRVGFFTTTFLFVLGFSYGFARSKPVQLLVAAAGFTVALYLIFVVLFRVPTPPGMVGF